MPSATSEQQRNNGVETPYSYHVPSTGDATCSNQPAGVSRNNGMDHSDKNLVPQIDPPEGFEPDSPSPSTSNEDSASQAPDPSIAARSNILGDCTHLGEGMSSPVAQSSDSPGGRPDEPPETTTYPSARTAPPRHNHSCLRDNNISNENPKPSTSSSSSRLVNGLNSIVTRISKVFANTSLSIINTDRCLQEEPPKFAFSNRRALEKTWKLMDKVVKCCQHPRMNLNNSPPFILEILPETYQHLKLIHAKYDSKPINDNEYSHIFLRNLQNRCEQTLKLFKDAKDEMYDEESEHRHKLTRNTLVFNHILSELRAIFPNGLFINDKYLITKKESAGEFWKNSFGTSVMVNWKTFYHALQQPWSTLLKNWQTLAVTHPGYKAFLTYDELKTRLQKYIDKPGSYVFRLSCTRLGQWAIGYVSPDGQILQTIVQNISLSQALTETKFYLYPDGKEEDPELRERLCSGMTGDEKNVTVTEEQYEIYCGVGNSFQTCKICFENDKDIRVEPCNHLLCTSCLIAWQESEGQGCPYCRTEIKETVQITMELPKSGHKG